MSNTHASSTYFSHLEHESLISINGPDATKFLQGQVTCDVQKLTQTASLGAHCTHKGRMLFSFFAAATTPENIYLRVPSEQTKTALAALNKYIVFSKAKTAVLSGWKKIGIWGENASDIIDSLSESPPKTDGEFSHSDSCIIIKLSNSRFECWLAPETELPNNLLSQHKATQVNPANWQLLDIQQGIGHIYTGNTEQLIPQLLNYQALGGISFTKGCYTGQEVVARMQYHGKLKRHMYRVQIPDNCSAPLSGTPIYSTASTQSVGNIVLASTTPGTAEALVVATDQSIEADDCYLDPELQQKLTLLKLPYAINEE